MFRRLANVEFTWISLHELHRIHHRLFYVKITLATFFLVIVEWTISGSHLFTHYFIHSIATTWSSYAFTDLCRVTARSENDVIGEMNPFYWRKLHRRTRVCVYIGLEDWGWGSLLVLDPSSSRRRSILLLFAGICENMRELERLSYAMLRAWKKNKSPTVVWLFGKEEEFRPGSASWAILVVCNRLLVITWSSPHWRLIITLLYPPYIYMRNHFGMAGHCIGHTASNTLHKCVVVSVGPPLFVGPYVCRAYGCVCMRMRERVRKCYSYEECSDWTGAIPTTYTNKPAGTHLDQGVFIKKVNY